VCSCKEIFVLKKYLLFILLGCLVTSPAYAYLDGGTGSVLVQGFIAGIAGFLAIAKVYWQKIKLIFQKVFGKKQKSKKGKNSQISEQKYKPENNE